MKSESLNKPSAAIQKVIIVLIVILTVAVFFILNYFADGNLLTVKNLGNVLAGSVVPTIVAFGFVVVFIGKVTDLSAGSIVILTATVTGLLGNSFGVPVMIIGGLLAGVACMTLNYAIYRITKIPPWIAGLGMTMIYEAVIVSYASWCAGQGQKVVVMKNEIRYLGQQPGIYLCWIAAIVVAYILFNHTTMGINYRAAGDNEEVSKIMGIRVDRAMLIGGIMAGLFFGFAGVVKESYAAFVNAQSGLTSLSTVFQPIAATLLAMALSNYLNLIIAVPISTFLITLVFNVLTIYGIPSGTFQDTILGVIVICFAIMAQRKEKGVVK